MSQPLVHKASHLGALVRSDPAHDPETRAINEIGRAWRMKREIPVPRVPVTAPCRKPGADPNAWSEEAVGAAVAEVSVRNRSTAAREYAADLCAGCDVKNDCLVYDLLMSKRIEGVVAGMTSKDRRALLRDITKQRPAVEVPRPRRAAPNTAPAPTPAVAAAATTAA